MSQRRSPRVLFAGGGTGGHLYPALALAEAFEARDPGAEIFFLGARRGVEARVLPERGVPHRLLSFEPIRRSRVWENWKLIPSLTSVAWGVSRTVREFRPDLIVGTGGYASGPVVAWGILHGIPTAIQEQNSSPGLTTRWLASRVRQLHLAFPEALEHLSPGPRTEVFELGNPIRPPDHSIGQEEARAKFGLRGTPVVLVVGGSQGAKRVNDALLRDLDRFAQDGQVQDKAGLHLLWATGPAHHERIAGEVRRLRLEDWVKPVPYIHEMTYALAAADLAVSRAGAMALAELCAWGIPSLLIPYPFAAANHQYHNAKALADAGAAVMITEEELAPGRLWSEMVTLAGDDGRRGQLAEHARERGHPDAAADIVDKLSTLIQPNQ
ncbi:MAG TPA: undecaprenyldiphospho-muramoylpentapeptide beta-N-acetylglucosaminyltransferase [Longimicrobiaceae bacterium]|nr:undecaprenyldiphospho-muramoylpentapeptide beta-N-acetylglucosaminyltransferase [Longimicrobiaceae bacterium]